jgi:hypothetical protein
VGWRAREGKKWRIGQAKHANDVSKKKRREIEELKLTESARNECAAGNKAQELRNKGGEKHCGRAGRTKRSGPEVDQSESIQADGNNKLKCQNQENQENGETRGALVMLEDHDTILIWILWNDPGMNEAGHE